MMLWGALGLNQVFEVPRVDAHAVKLLAMIGRCDGWMGLTRGR